MPKNGCLCTKHGLLATLETYYPALGLDTFDVMPLTFAVPGLGQHGVASDAFAAFARVFRLIERKGQTAGAGAGVRCPARWLGKNVWLLKPAALNCGKGIAVCRTMEEIVRKLGKLSAPSCYRYRGRLVPAHGPLTHPPPQSRKTWTPR